MSCVDSGESGSVSHHYKRPAPPESWATIDGSFVLSDFLDRFQSAQDVAVSGDADRAMTELLRSAALETGAIEGLYQTTRGVTRTVAEQAPNWASQLDLIGPEVRGHFSAQLGAFEHVVEVAKDLRPPTEVWLRELHALTAANQRTYAVHTPGGVQERELRHGQYKQYGNSVETPDGRHEYCPAEDVSAEMAYFVESLRSEAFKNLSPIQQASYAHYALVAIHPFADGNGRTARALATVYLYRGLGIPLVVFSDQQEEYWDALAAGDRGQLVQFARFIEDRVLDALAVVTLRLQQGGSRLSSAVEQLDQVRAAHGGLEFSEVHAVGQRLLERIHNIVKSEARGLEEDGLTIKVGARKRLAHVNFGADYHPLKTLSGFQVSVGTLSPVPTTQTFSPTVGLSDSPNATFAFICIDASRPADTPLSLRMSGVHPQLATSAEELIRVWVEGRLMLAVDNITERSRAALRQEGFDL